MAQLKEVPMPPFDGYESVIYLEEKYSKQLYVLRTWYEGATYTQAVQSQADIIASFDDNKELVVTNGYLEGVPKK